MRKEIWTWHLFFHLFPLSWHIENILMKSNESFLKDLGWVRFQIEYSPEDIFSISLFQLPLYSNRCCLQLREQSSSDLSWSQISVGWWLASDYHSYLTRPKSQHSILPELSFMQKKFPIACPSLSIQSQASEASEALSYVRRHRKWPIVRFKLSFHKHPWMQKDFSRTDVATVIVAWKANNCFQCLNK